MAAGAHLDGLPVHLGPAVAPGAGPDVPAARRYVPPASLATLVRTRDGHCRFPGCTVPAASCDLDHVVPFDHDDPRRGGTTSADNLACLCRFHHRLKTVREWAVRMTPDGVQHWTGPRGQHLRSVVDGMPPTGSGPRRGAAPVWPGERRVLRPPAPPPDLPPDDDPPSRWTPDGHWADDPWAEEDLWTPADDGAVEELVRGVRTAAAAGSADLLPPF